MLACVLGRPRRLLKLGRHGRPERLRRFRGRGRLRRFLHPAPLSQLALGIEGTRFLLGRVRSFLGNARRLLCSLEAQGVPPLRRGHHLARRGLRRGLCLDLRLRLALRLALRPAFCLALRLCLEACSRLRRAQPLLRLRGRGRQPPCELHLVCMCRLSGLRLCGRPRPIHRLGGLRRRVAHRLLLCGLFGLLEFDRMCGTRRADLGQPRFGSLGGAFGRRARHRTRLLHACRLRLPPRRLRIAPRALGLPSSLVELAACALGLAPGFLGRPPRLLHSALRRALGRPHGIALHARRAVPHALDFLRGRRPRRLHPTLGRGAPRLACLQLASQSRHLRIHCEAGARHAALALRAPALPPLVFGAAPLLLLAQRSG